MIHKQRNEYYNNINIMNNLTISDIDIIEYIKLTKNEILIIRTQELLNSNPKYLLQNYDKSCKYFYLFYNKLFDDIGLFDFHGITFGLNLLSK